MNNISSTPFAADPRKRRPHQKTAVKDVLAHFKQFDAGQLIMACGTGKTLTAQFIATDLDAKRILVLTPSLSLLSDTLHDWQQHFGDFEYLAVCSDDTVVDKNTDETIHSVDELDFAVKVTTDTSKIRAFLSKRGRRLVVFSTYQSSPRIAAAFKASGLGAFDLVIADEAHRTAGEVSSDFATVLDRKAIHAKRRLFMTATPRRYNDKAKKMARDADLEIISMDDESTYGKIAHKLSFKSAVDKNLLSPYQVVIICVGNRDHLRLAQSGKAVSHNARATDATTLAKQFGLIDIIRVNGLSRVITFHSRVKGAHDFAETLGDAYASMLRDGLPERKLWTGHVSGMMRAVDRKMILNQLRDINDSDEFAVLTNAQCLSEGIDVPALDAVAFIDPRQSEVDIIQAVGRVMRKPKDGSSKIGYVFIPVMVDEDEDHRLALQSGEYKRVWDVVDALQSHDESLGEKLDRCRVRSAEDGHAMDFPDEITIYTAGLEIPSAIEDGFRSSISAKVIKGTTEDWGFMHRLVLAYVAREGHLPPRECVEYGFNIGQWLKNQRHAIKNGTLSPEREALVRAIPGFVVDQFEEQWQKYHQATLAYVAREGRIPPDGCVEQGLNIGDWCRTQRHAIKNGTLSPEHEALVRAIPGFVVDKLEEQWQKYHQATLAYVAREGRIPPKNCVEQGLNIGDWCRSQRRAIKNGTLSPEREALVRAIPGFVVDRREEQWRKYHQATLAYVAREGRIPPEGRIEQGLNIGAWCRTQRMAYRNGKLSDERIALLEAIPGWYW